MKVFKTTMVEKREDSVIAALTKGDWATRLSAVIMGLGCAAHRQVVKGILIFALEVAYIFFMVTTGWGCLADLPGLGENEQGKVWNEAKQVFEATGLTADDMDLVMVNDFIGSSAFLAAEEIGYLPKGEGWKYVLEGRTAYDGDKPINTKTSTCSAIFQK